MLHYMLVAALGISAAAGGTYGAERLLDRFGRIPQPTVVADAEPVSEEDEGSEQARAD